MSQGYTGYTILDNQITIKDGPNLDAFSRLRVSNPLTIFSNQFTYDLSPLIFEQVSNNPGAAYAVHESTDRCAAITFNTASPGDNIYMQSYEYIPYQPGRSQLVFITFNMFPSGAVTFDSEKIVGLGDNDNGFYFKHNYSNNNLLSFEITSNTNAGTEIVYQSNWNLDKLDGTGPSGINLEIRRTQILVIDFQALYVGRVRFGFDIGGQIIYAHEFLHANIFSYPYIATANLPIRVGMYSISGVDDTMHFICCSVASEGGLDDSQRFGYNFIQGGNTNVAIGTYLMSLRPTPTFAGYVNRTKFILQEIEFINVGNKPIKWQLSIDATAAGMPVYNPVNATYSAIEYDTVGSYTPGTIIIDEGYVPSGGANKGGGEITAISSKYPITLDANNAPRTFGTLTLTADVIGIGNSDVYWAFKWKEIR